MGAEAAEDTVAWRIGRYDIVARLASGGMAEILLARLLGPSGFQRALVIKRILPHLASEKGFRQMFLDEARIVAGIRHPNVVQVHELGSEGEDLFLAMEYIEGESTAGLMRRLHLKEERLPYAMAAYIIAEACNGLHAAHELADATGKPLEIVHRDASPHNLFISYVGGVKVLDFGIATAADRIARTEAGQFKGKFEYASPEQCKGVTLDRRSDLFSLGTVLWELTVGRRLFKRASNLEMLKAICEQPIPTPRSVVPDFPESLERVITRSLSRSRRKRYQTAQEMRQDLLGVLRELSPSLTPEDDLGKLMQRLFADRRQEKAEILRRVQAGTQVVAMPENDADLDVELPIVVTVDYNSIPPAEDGGTVSETGTDAKAADIPSAPRLPSDPDLLSSSGVGPLPHDDPGLSASVALPTRGPSPRLVAGAVAAVTALLALVAVLIVTRKKPDAPTRDETPQAPVSVAAPPTVSVAPPPPPPPPPPSATVAAPSKVTIHVDTSPSKAQVLVAGVKKGFTPIDIEVPSGKEPLRIEVKRTGYHPLTETVTPDANQRLKLTLVPASAPATKPTGGAPYHRFD